MIQIIRTSINNHIIDFRRKDANNPSKNAKEPLKDSDAIKHDEKFI